MAAILTSRRIHALRLEDVARLTVSISKIRPSIITANWRQTALADQVAPVARAHTDAQLELFAA